MNIKLILAVALAAVSFQAKSDTWLDRGLQMAQLSEAEREQMKRRWQSLPPDERAQLRQEFHHRLQALPPEEREMRRQEILDRWERRGKAGQGRDARRERYQDEQASSQVGDDEEGRGFGRGYERRGMSRGEGRGH